MLADIQNLPSRDAIEQEMLWRKAVSFRFDPLGFVLWAYPWGKPGPLEKYAGPDDWQADFLGSLERKSASEISTASRRCCPSGSPHLPVTASGRAF